MMSRFQYGTCGYAMICAGFMTFAHAGDFDFTGNAALRCDNTNNTPYLSLHLFEDDQPGHPIGPSLKAGLIGIQMDPSLLPRRELELQVPVVPKKAVCEFNGASAMSDCTGQVTLVFTQVPLLKTGPWSGMVNVKGQKTVFRIKYAESNNLICNRTGR